MTQAPDAQKRELVIELLMNDADNYAQSSVDFANIGRCGAERDELEENLREAFAAVRAALPQAASEPTDALDTQDPKP